jgi:coenzyme F420-reducing hydrogenase alpha subunit
MGGCVASLGYMLGHWDRHTEEVRRRQLEDRIEQRLDLQDSKVDSLDRVIRNMEQEFIPVHTVKVHSLETTVEELESKLNSLEDSEKEEVDE